FSSFLPSETPRQGAPAGSPRPVDGRCPTNALSRRLAEPFALHCKTMPPLFTRFVQSLDEAPDETLALAVWGRLREILEHELKRRGLWHHPPAYLGICAADWRGGPEDDGALDELVAECYGFIFVDRLERLRAQLAQKPNIEGLVLLNVR